MFKVCDFTAFFSRSWRLDKHSPWVDASAPASPPAGWTASSQEGSSSPAALPAWNICSTQGSKELVSVWTRSPSRLTCRPLCPPQWRQLAPSDSPEAHRRRTDGTPGEVFRGGRGRAAQTGGSAAGCRSPSAAVKFQSIAAAFIHISIFNRSRCKK